MKNKVSSKNTNPTHVTRGGEFNLTSKLRLQDFLPWEDTAKSIKYLINKHPIQLWNRIHKKNSDVSLVRTAYAKLKINVAKINPALVEEVNKQHENHKALRKIKIEITNGILGGKNSRFKKVSSVKVTK
jgi:hypothetical protein